MSLAAFDAYSEAQPGIAQFRNKYLSREQRLPVPSQPTVYCEIGDPAAELAARVEQRRDVPESRTKWRFGVRQEAVLSSSGAKS